MQHTHTTTEQPSLLHFMAMSPTGRPGERRSRRSQRRPPGDVAEMGSRDVGKAAQGGLIWVARRSGLALLWLVGLRRTWWPAAEGVFAHGLRHEKMDCVALQSVRGSLSECSASPPQCLGGAERCVC